MTKQPRPAELSRRQALKTYAAPTIAVIGVAATASFSTSGRVDPLGRVVPLPDTDAVGKAKGKDKGKDEGKGKGK
jgi:hypothetical protein